ncbi:MAG: alkaline phosphatase family protein [Nitrospirales bacterium]
MIAILQFDSTSLMHLENMLGEGNLPTLASLRSRGTWLDLETPATHLEGAAAYSLYTGTGVANHGLFYPWLWSPTEQRVRFFEDLPAPEAVWERVSRAGLRSLIIDPYEMRPPKNMNGIFLSGWQFKNRVVLTSRSVPSHMHRKLTREFGRPPLGEEVYGRPAAPELVTLKNNLVTAPLRGAEAIEGILKREQFDLIWISLSSAHLGGHRFLDVTRYAEEIDLNRHQDLRTALKDIYMAVDQAMARILASLPPGTDIIILSPSGMGPNTSRSHLLPGMLEAVLTDNPLQGTERSASSGGSLWRVRSMVPTSLRALIARAMPDRWANELAARLELRGIDWNRTKGFMLPNDDVGYVRLNLRGRERDGVVEPEQAEKTLDEIIGGLQTFQNNDGTPAIQRIDRVADLGLIGSCTHLLPDLLVHWNERLVSPLAGVKSNKFGKVESSGWGTGRTGCHNGDSWALLVPGSSKIKTPIKPPHIIDIVTTICEILGVDSQGLAGQSLLKVRSDNG